MNSVNNNNNIPKSSKTFQIIKLVLYELQPCRIIDIIDSYKWLKRNSCKLFMAFVALSRAILKTSLHINTTHLIYAILWVITWMAFIYIDFGSIWIIISLFLLLFNNLGTKKEGELSAYSVFNKGFKQLLGTLNADQFDKEIRHQTNNHNSNDLDDDMIDEVIDINHEVKRNIPRKSGKKARRKYEEKLQRREAQADAEGELMNELIN
eukprot:gene7632-10390_t